MGSFSTLTAKIIGNDSHFQQERSLIRFPVNEENRINSLTSLLGGFSLEDRNTTCTYASLFPVSGAVFLNGGQFILNEDLSLKSEADIYTSGVVEGGFHTVEFPRKIPHLIFPRSTERKGFNYLADDYLGFSAHTADWSHDDGYLAFGAKQVGLSAELRIVGFDGKSLAFTTSYDVGESVRSINWHPKEHILAIGKTAAEGIDNLQILRLNKANNGQLEVIAEDDLDIRDVYAVSWHPTGSFLATAHNTYHGELSIYQFDQNTFKEVTSAGFDHHHRVRDNALCWDPTGSYLAVGVHKTLFSPQLFIYHFDGTDLTLTSSAEIDGGVVALDWSPTGSDIAVGLSGSLSGERLRVFHHDRNQQTLFEKKGCRVGETQNILSLQWDREGKVLALGKLRSSKASEASLYIFDGQSLTLSDMYGIDRSIFVARWSHSGEYLMLADSLRQVRLYHVNDRFVFDRTLLSFNSDVRVQVPLVFKGKCSVDSGGHEISLPSTLPIVLNTGADVTFNNTALLFPERSLGQSSLIQFNHARDKLTFKNVDLHSPGHLVATPGNIYMKGDCRLKGSYGFMARCRDGATLSLTGETRLTDRLLCEGRVHINGNGNILDLSSGGLLILTPGAQLHLSNIVLKGLGRGAGNILRRIRSRLTRMRRSGTQCGRFTCMGE